MRRILKDLTGQRFGRLIVVARAPNYGTRAAWVVRCDCGLTERVAHSNNLLSGRSRSCGCVSAEKTRRRSTTHGHTAGGRDSPVYSSWSAMLDRCRNPRCPDFDHYGGRGIVVCERWRTFENFLADMGERPPGHSLDRIDFNGHYEPGNCRWATQKEQTRNSSRNRFVTYHGTTLCLSEWAEYLGLDYQLLQRRLDRGWDVAKTFTTLARAHKPYERKRPPGAGVAWD